MFSSKCQSHPTVYIVCVDDVGECCLFGFLLDTGFSFRGARGVCGWVCACKLMCLLIWDFPAELLGVYLTVPPSKGYA